MSEQRMRSLCVLSVILSTVSMLLSFWCLRADLFATRSAVYKEIVQELDSVLMPTYEEAHIRLPSDDERKTIKGVLNPLFRISHKVR
jgi:hypothetical protein